MRVRIFSAILAAAVISLAAVLSFSCAKKNTDKGRTEASVKTSASTTAPAETAPPVAETEKETEGVISAPGETISVRKGSAASSVQIRKITYTNNDVRIEYPTISGLQDKSWEERVNAHLKENALSILKNYPDSAEPMDESQDTLDIECDVLSLDANRLTVVYNGYYNMKDAIHPSNIFYSNTVSLRDLQDLTIKEFTDPYTFAGYILSDDVVLKNAGKEVTEAFKEYRSSLTVEQLTKCLKAGDFPLQHGSDKKSYVWPDSFSYEDSGEIFVSIPVPYALGDYVIVEYSPDTK